jgi:hypothetical protein
MLKSKAPEASNAASSTRSIFLPDELMNLIGDYLPTHNMSTVARTCPRFFNLFKGELKDRYAKELMDYILKPTQENVRKAKAMIAAHPKLMFIETVGVEWASGVEETLDVTGEPRRRWCIE